MHGWLILPAVFISVGFICYGEGKTFSINKAIEEELARRKINKTVTTTTTEATTTEKQLISKYAYKSTPKLKTLKEILAERSKKITPIKFKKLFQIKLPLKPKLGSIPRIKRKHQSLKRDTDKNVFNEKYPLLRRIRLLLDNLVTSESVEHENNKQQYITSAERDLLCPCARSSRTEAEPAEETAPSSTVTVTAYPLQPALATKTPRPPTNHPTLSNLRSLRQNQKLPLLPPRDTTSSKRNNHGISKGSSATRNWDLKRAITWNHRPGQHNTQREASKTDAEVYDKHADVDTRDSTSGHRAFRRQLRSRNPTDSKRAPAARLLQRLETIDPETTTITFRETGGNLKQHQNEDQHEIKRDEEKSPEFIRGGPKRSSELAYRRPVPANQISNIGKSIQSNETDENRHIDVSQHLTSYQGVTNGDGTFTGENKGLRKENEAVISLNRSELVSFQNVPMNKSVVVIIDGYSVTRSKNGENKFSEKSVRLQPVRDNSTGDMVLSFNNK